MNGSINAGKALIVEKSLKTVNGSVIVGAGSQIGKDITTVNGNIELVNFSVARNVRTVNGDIRLTEGTIIVGDVIVEQSNAWLSNGGILGEPQFIEIDADSEVKGVIHLYKQVKLKLAENAIVGGIQYHFKRK